MRARPYLRRASCGLLAAACLAVSACGSGEAGGSGSAAAPPGSPSNPLIAQQPEEAGAQANATGFDKLLEQQREAPQGRDAANVCALVTKAQAQRVSTAPLRDPFLAPQGPTCVYRYRSGASFATIAIQPVRISMLRRQMQDVRRVDVSRRKGYCGVHGRPVLYVPLAAGRVLSIAAPCDDAVQLARLASSRLGR